MTEILFLRHAESVSNAGGITMPHNAIPLSDRGFEQAAELARMFDSPPSRVLVSGMARAHQTAEPLCRRHSLTPEIHPELNEFSVIDPVLIAGLSSPDRKPFVRDYWETPDPRRRNGADADTFLEFVSRVRAFTETIPRLPNGTVIVGHGIWCAMLHWIIAGLSANDCADMLAFRHFQQSLPMPNCAGFRIRCFEGKRISIDPSEVLNDRIL